jgi:hypothetical protein
VAELVATHVPGTIVKPHSGSALRPNCCHSPLSERPASLVQALRPYADLNAWPGPHPGTLTLLVLARVGHRHRQCARPANLGPVSKTTTAQHAELRLCAVPCLRGEHDEAARNGPWWDARSGAESFELSARSDRLAARCRPPFLPSPVGLSRRISTYLIAPCADVAQACSVAWKRPTRGNSYPSCRHRTACTAEARPCDGARREPARVLDYRLCWLPRTMRISRTPPSAWAAPSATKPCLR